jgi:hypothetical protein
MSLQLSGYESTDTVDFPLFFHNLFTQIEEAIWCLAIGSQDGPGFNIIGNIAQADHYIETDLENKRIGWTLRDCTLPM